MLLDQHWTITGLLALSSGDCWLFGALGVALALGIAGVMEFSE